MLSGLALIAVLAAAPPVGACDPEAPTQCAVPLLEGQPAPFAGQLLTTDLALSLGLAADQCGIRTRLEVATATKAAEIRCARDRALLRIDLDTATVERDVLRVALEAAQARTGWSFYDILLAGGVGVAVGSVAVVGIAVAVR